LGGHRKSGWTAYGLAISAGAATILGLAAPQAAERPALWAFLSLAALMLSAATGGLGPTFVCAAVALICGAVFLHVGAPAALAVASLGAGVALLGERGRRVRQRASATTSYLREREVHLQSILDTAPDGMVVFDARGIVRAFSAAAERQFGWTAAEAIGASVEQFLPGARRIALAGDLEPTTANGARRDGASFPVELSLADSGRGDRRFFTAFVRDLSEQADAAARLELLQSELRHVSRLTAMGEVAEGGDDDVSEPLAAIAHYLRGGRRALAIPALGGEELALITQRVAQLSARERQVLEGLVAGQANKAIAFGLSISPRTVEIYRAKLMTKMKAKSLSELVRMALVADA
jgi:two-component system sensor kinase FixL